VYLNSNFRFYKYTHYYAILVVLGILTNMGRQALIEIPRNLCDGQPITPKLELKDGPGSKSHNFVSLDQEADLYSALTGSTEFGSSDGYCEEASRNQQ